MINVCPTHSNIVNSGVTVPSLTKFLYNVEKLLQFSTVNLELRYSNLFWNDSA